MSRTLSIIAILIALQVLCVKEIFCGPAVKTVNLSNEEIAHLQEIGREFREKLSPEIDPCADFYGHVCAKTNQSRFYNMYLNRESKIAEIVENYLLQTEKLSNAELKLKSYIESCKNTLQDADKILKSFLKEFNFPDSIGGWPAFNPDWNPEKFDLQSAIAELTIYFPSVIIDQTFDVDRRNFRMFLFINIGDFSFTSAYGPGEGYRHMTQLGIEDTSQEISDALELEKECKEIRYAATTEDRKAVETDFSGLKKQIPEIDWDKQMETMTGQKLREDFPVVIRNGGILRKILAAISKMNPKIVANYFFVHFARSLPGLRYLGTDKECLSYATDDFKPVVSGILLKQYFAGKHKSILSEMIQSLIKNILASLEGIPSKEIGEDIEPLVNEEYLPAFSDENLQKEYENVTIDPKNFLHNRYALKRQLSPKKIQHILSRKDGKVEVIKYYLIWLSTDNFYEALNKSPVLVYDAIAFHPIARFTDLLSHELIDDSLLECLTKQISGQELKRREIEGAVAAHIFTNGYLDWAFKNEEIVQAEDEILQGYGLTIKKILFIRFMEYHCGEDDLEAKNLKSSLFWNLRQFADTFSCPAGSRMNPAEKCQIL